MLVTRQVVSYARRRAETGLLISEEILDLPERRLPTRAVWWTISAAQRADLAAAGLDLPGAAHAAEHAAIGLLPLVAACDRWDVGGVSADLHPATGKLTVFVYDGHAGGAGFAERGFAAAAAWLTATADAIASCECAAGCPSCIQSPKCGNGNHPLAKADAVTLLRCLLAGTPAAQGRLSACTPRVKKPVKGGVEAPPKSGPRPGRRLGEPRHGATPVGGENGGRHTVRLRGGRAGSVTQESLVAFGASYQPVKPNRKGSGAIPYAAGPWVHPSRAAAELRPLSLTWTKRSSPGRAPWRSRHRFTGTG